MMLQLIAGSYTESWGILCEENGAGRGGEHDDVGGDSGFTKLGVRNGQTIRAW